MHTTLTSRFLAQPQSRQIILVLHGRGDSMAGFAWLPTALALPVNYLFVNAPDPYYTGFSWYDLPPNQAPGVERSRALLDQLFVEIAHAGYRASDVVLFGFSQGCLMALEWGGRTQLRLAGFVGVSGYCLDEVALDHQRSLCSQSVPWLITHGYEDEALPYARSATQVDYLTKAGWPIEFHSLHKGHTIDEATEMPLIRAWLRKTFQIT